MMENFHEHRTHPCHIVTLKLAPDMLPFASQIRIA